jgi:hypothetical protein
MALEVSNPSIHTTGPIHIYVGMPAYVAADGVTNVAAKQWYLGATEIQPQMEIQRLDTAVYSDIVGRKVPHQLIDQGQMGRLGLALTYWSQAALVALKTQTGMYNGVDSKLGRGSLVLGRTTATIWLQYSFYGTANATTNLPPGRMFYAARMTSETMAESGTAAEKPLLAFTCLPLYNSSTGAHSLYSEAPADFPNTLIPQ